MIKSHLLEPLINKFIDNRELFLKLLPDLLDFKEIKNNYSTEFDSILTIDTFIDVVDKFENKLILNYPFDVVKIAVDKIKGLIKINNYIFQFCFRKVANFGTPNIHAPSYEEEIVLLIIKMLIYSKNNINSIRDEIRCFINEEHYIFRYIALKIINDRYDELNDLFWSWENGNPLDEYFTQETLVDFINEHKTIFKPEQLNQLVDWIETTPNKEKHNYSETLIVEIKFKWLYLLKNLNNKRIDKLFEKYKEKADIEDIDELFAPKIISQKGSISPKSKNELLEMSNIEIVQLLINFDYNEHRLGKPTKEGLADELKNAISENPSKFCRDLELFVNVKGIYINDILYGFQVALKDEKVFDWNFVLKFVSDLIASESFWIDNKNETTQSNNNEYRNSIVSNIAQIIEYGTYNKINSLPVNSYNKAKEILLTLNKNVISTTTKLENIIMDILNHSKGIIYSALISLSFIIKHNKSKQEDNVWDVDIKNIFEQNLENETDLLFFGTIGRYLNLIFYSIDKNWITMNINKIFPLNDELRWKASFIGYLGLTRIVDSDIFTFLEQHGNYSKAIKTDFLQMHLNNYLVDHICLMFISEWNGEDTNYNLMNELIDNRNKNQLLEIIWIYTIQKKEEDIDKIKSFIKFLWVEIFRIISDDKDQFKEVFIDLLDWLPIIDNLDNEILNMCKESIKYVNNNYHYTNSLKNGFLKHIDNYPIEISQLYLDVLNTGYYPFFFDHDAVELITKLFKKSTGNEKLRTNTNIICNKYFDKGSLFLRETYEKYNSD